MIVQLLHDACSSNATTLSPIDVCSSFMYTKERKALLQQNTMSPFVNIITHDKPLNGMGLHICPTARTDNSPSSTSSSSQSPTLVHLQSRTLCVRNVQDKLFGAVYLAVNGHNATMDVVKRFGNVDTEEKNKIASFLQDRMLKGISKLSRMTNHTCTKVLCSKMIMDLTTCKTMPFYCTIALSLYYQCTIVIVDTTKKTLLPFYFTGIAADGAEESPPATIPVYVLYKNPGHKEKSKMAVPKYFVDTTGNAEGLQSLKDKYIELVSYEKPLKGASTYKVSELEEMAKKLGWTEKMKKSELYERICVHCTS
jgi:hypothetical protein